MKWVGYSRPTCEPADALEECAALNELLTTRKKWYPTTVRAGSLISCTSFMGVWLGRMMRSFHKKKEGFFAFGFTLATYPEHQRKGVSNRSGATWQSTFRPVRHSRGEVLYEKRRKRKKPDEMVRGVVVVVVLTTITRQLIVPALRDIDLAFLPAGAGTGRYG